MTPFPSFAEPADRSKIVRNTLTRNEAAFELGLSLAGIDKLIHSGIAEVPLPASLIAKFSSYPALKVKQGELTVLRTDARRAAAPGDGRQYIGFHTEHTDDQLKETSLGWWRSDPSRVLDNELFAVTVSTIPVAVYQITGHSDPFVRPGETAPRYQYEGQLLARIHPGMGSPTVRKNTPGHLRKLAEQIMNSRITVSSGGPIGYLEAH